MSGRAGSWDVVERAGELARRGEEFALATVVWRQGPSSSTQGSRAIVTASGELHGWIGGACAEPVVIREAQRAIADGEPRLLLLGTPEQFTGVHDGMTVDPDRLPERGSDGDLRRTCAGQPTPRHRRPVADGAHALPSSPATSTGRPT